MTDCHVSYIPMIYPY